MSKLHPLRLHEVEFAGARLVEASAGTGKTYTIAGLYLSLVAERGLRVEDILVVTFTKAATAELRERIRKRLVEARQAFVAGESEEDFLATLIARAPDREQTIRRLERAVVDFDQAAVFTIHGFCQRALAEHAFESGVPFETELLSDQDALIQEVLDDVWRREACAGDPRLVRYLLEKRLSPEAMLRELKPWLGKPYLELRVPPTEQALDACEDAMLRCWRAAAESWRQTRGDVLSLLAGHPGVNRRSYTKANVPRWAAELDAYFAEQPTSAAPCPNLFRFTNRALAEKAGDKTPPSHPLFDLCEALQDACDAYGQALIGHFAAFKARALRTLWNELPALKRRRQVQCFDDLLTGLRQAMLAQGGAALIDKLRQTYKAALIDEFQDTDPLQWDIFDRLFREAGIPWFLVGDPKQAIYSFRGADIYAYLAAKQATPEGYTLDTNWRSDPPLIEAVNALFCRAPQPFLFDAIEFAPVLAADRPRTALVEQGDTLPPFRFWCLDGGDGVLAKGVAVPQAAEATAAEIARLLQSADAGQLSIDGRPLEGGDIAVLVRKHNQGAAVIQALQACGISCVQQSRDKVFDSEEAAELERIVCAVLEPTQEALVRAALATACLGADGEALMRLSQDERAWDAVLERFQGYHVLWRDHGFMRFIRAFLRAEGVHARLLAYVDGERRLTNLLHLAELLHAHAAETGVGPEGLVAWLVRHRQDPGTDEAAELRLESDERLVKVVTIHASKGLEYPVVFCPFLWDGPSKDSRTPPVAFHDPASGNNTVLDYGSDDFDRACALADQEQLAEDLRLVYVALTRARHRCYVVWGKCNGTHASGLAWLLHGRHVGEQPPLAGLKALFQERATAELRADLEALAAACPQAVAVQPIPAGAAGRVSTATTAAPVLTARRFNRELRHGWRVTSFSWLAGQVTPAAEAPDYDAEPSLPTEPVEATGIFAFPRGSRPGTCLHEIFEHWDFVEPDDGKLHDLVGRTLARYGFAADWTETVAGMVRNVLATPLDGKGLHLGQLKRSQRLDELEFHYPLTRFDGSALATLLRRHGFLPEIALQERIGRLQFALDEGFMKGFIDLVFEHDGRFFIADYKSNWLGPDYPAYGAEALAEVMAEHGYYLQYLIYMLALHRYLSVRLPGYDYDRHIGGAYYLFLRGMSPEHGIRSGVFHDRPPAALIEALDYYLQTGRITETADVV